MKENGMILSKGLKSRIIAKSGRPVKYSDGKVSKEIFHRYPDGAHCFNDPDEPGGWIYVSNSEVRKSDGENEGGVGAIRFNKTGAVTNYEMVLKGTTANCGGGRTPWNTWLSAEENGSEGHIYEVDPTGKRQGKFKTQLSGGRGGNYESVAYDNRNGKLFFFVTNDSPSGEVRRYEPSKSAATDSNKWNRLKDGNGGEHRCLVLDPSKKTFIWSRSLRAGKDSARKHFPNCEGIDRIGGRLYFTCKTRQQLFILNLDNMKYEEKSTNKGLFDGNPDQIARIIGAEYAQYSDRLLYFCEDGGRNAGIHARNTQGQYFTILEGTDYGSETTGLCFTRDKKRMYFSFQKEGVIVEVRREDGCSFDGRVADTKYHSPK